MPKQTTKFRITLYDPHNRSIRQHATRDPEKAAELFDRIGKRLHKLDRGSGLILHRLVLTQGNKTLQTHDARGVEILQDWKGPTRLGRPPAPPIPLHPSDTDQMVRPPAPPSDVHVKFLKSEHGQGFIATLRFDLGGAEQGWEKWYGDLRGIALLPLSPPNDWQELCIERLIRQGVTFPKPIEQPA